MTSASAAESSGAVPASGANEELQSLERRSSVAPLAGALAGRLLALRAEALARSPADDALSPSTVETVAFEVSGSKFAVGSREVLEVRALGRLSRLPGALAAILGVVVFRGRLVSVVDLAALLGGGATRARRPEARVVIVESERGTLAFVCDSLLGLRSLDTKSLKEPRDASGCLRGNDGDGHALLHVDRVMERLALASRG
ncbi:MAG: chemotaxis protein CheW [Deltaproteobacteria bacterium]